METSIQDWVLWAIADDYESLEIIFVEVNKWTPKRGRRITRQQIIRALERLIREGSAEAYLLSSQPPYNQPVEFLAKDAEGLWFYVTPKGKDLVRRLVENRGGPPIGKLHQK